MVLMCSRESLRAQGVVMCCGVSAGCLHAVVLSVGAPKQCQRKGNAGLRPKQQPIHLILHYLGLESKVVHYGGKSAIWDTALAVFGWAAVRGLALMGVMQPALASVEMVSFLRQKDRQLLGLA